MDTEQAPTASGQITRGLAESLSVLAESGATGNERTVLVWLLHGMDWKDGSGETWISTDTIADRGGIARSTACEALRKLTGAGVVVCRARFNGVARRIDWTALAGYRSQPTKRGGDRPNIGQVSELRTVRTPDTGVRTSDSTRPVIGQGVSELRARSSHYPPIDPPSDPPKEKHAPAPAVADLFASLDSQTSADTGKATTGGERSAGVAEPAKPKRSRKANGGDADPAYVDAVIGLWAKVCPRTEKQAARMKASQPVRRQIAAAIDRDGADVVKARFAYIAGGSGGQAEWARKCIADESRPMQIDALLRDPSRQDRNKGGPPWVATVDGEAADWTEQTASGTTMTPRALAVEAWANMMLDPRWKSVCMPGNAPNAPGDFGNPTRWDLADTAEEHDRRMTCFRLSGSIPKWRDADAEGRRQFRERWIELYAKEVTA